ncbi:hypothetical protein HPB49_007151 [Dermacentor silvarum]|uniref:Uncharacterized protein n=1 Tax=Dermacentor silvarum TaxID=543639 RepID=A0ACB8CJQ9_DERSI|nr:hypothetical protein HPB49_007151 [Dermacentor silvarum]
MEPTKTGQCTKFGESYYSHACSVTTAEGKQCLRCKYTRKLIRCADRSRIPNQDCGNELPGNLFSCCELGESSQKPKKTAACESVCGRYGFPAKNLRTAAKTAVGCTNLFQSRVKKVEPWHGLRQAVGSGMHPDADEEPAAI